MTTHFRRFLAGASLFGIALSVALVAFIPPVAYAVDRETAEFKTWLDEKAAFFAANPERQHIKGSGWKPYNRAKWFNEQRMTNGELPPAGARWRVWEHKVQLERASGVAPRSTWFTMGPTNFAGRMLAIAFHPNQTTAYAGAAGGGVWKTTDSGASWFPVSDEIPSLAVGGIALSLSDPEIVVIGTGEATNNIDVIGGVGILRSTDGGATWGQTSLSYTVFSGHGFHVIETNPINGTMLAGARDGLWRSTDDGQNWTQVRDDGDYFDVKWKPGDANRVYAAKGDGSSGNKVKVSTDDGLTFENAGTGQPASFAIGKTKIAVTAAAPQTIYAIYADRGTSGNLVGVYRSLDDGANWTLQAASPNIPGGQGWYNLSLAADPNNADRVIAGGVQLYRSNDGGVTFGTLSGPHVDHHDARYVPGLFNRVWVASDGGIWSSTNDGTSWTDSNNGLTSYQFYDICVNNGPTAYYILGGTQDNGTDKWSGSTVWANSLGADGMVCNVSAVNGTTVYGEIQFGDHRKNVNSGIGGWSSINNGITGTGAWVTPVDLDPNDTDHLYTATGSGTFRSTDGANWTLVDSQGAQWYSISPVDGDVIWAGGGLARHSTDDGASWTDAAPFGFLTGGFTKILAHPTDLATAFVTFSGYDSAAAHVLRTTDMGVSWENVTGDFVSQPVNAIAVNPSEPTQWFIGTDVGVWSSTNGGVNWLPFETGFPNAVVVDLEIQDALQKLVAGTHGRGAWEIDIPAITGTDVAIGAPQALPLMLDPPAPNPARDQAMLRFAAKHEGPVTLEIYDVAGRLVSRVAELPRGDGVIRNAPWLTDDVSSGVYFAVLRAGSMQKSQKLIVAK
jgi:hypothetical protein